MIEQKCYAAWAKSEDIRNVSSSGGLFAVLAEWILDRNGIVFGAFQDQDNRLYHIPVFEKNDLTRIQKSKYYQSEVFEAYEQAKQFLSEGRTVLFSGTACQIAGLHGSLGNPTRYEGKLYTVEVLCHGVSNKRVYHRYLESQARIYKKQVITSTFRTKEIPWKDGGGTSSTLFFADGKTKLKRSTEDDFFIGFNQNLILRPSCYRCPFTGTKRYSDILLGDYWGIKEDIVSLKTQEKGVSLVLVSSSDGAQLWDNIQEKIEYHETAIEDAAAFNMSLVKPVSMHPNRALFFRKYRKHDFHRLIVRCCYKEFLYRRLWMILGDRGMQILKMILMRSK